MKHFWGAGLLHWTPENATPATRVSIDFRLVAGRGLGGLFDAVACSGGEPGGQRDVFRGSEGYYATCARAPRRHPHHRHDGGAAGGASSAIMGGDGGGVGRGGDDRPGPIPWERRGPLPPPDARVGFPFTVKDWGKWERKKKKKGGGGPP